jgi:hypothetical protein
MTNIPATLSERLRQAIDRRVVTARIVHGLGVVGRIGCVAAGTWAASLLIGGCAGGHVNARLVAGTVLVAAAIAAWFFSRRALASWPTRLSIALAAERAQPELGEQISRAIDFLDSAASGDGSTALKSIALEQAADAADRIIAAPTEGAARHLGFAAAAAFALALLTIDASRRDTVSTPATATREVPAPDASPENVRPAFDRLSEAGQAAARIAALAGFERQLADALAGWFVEAPGLAAVDVPPRRRLAIAEAATLHDECLAGIASAAKVITTAAAAEAPGDAAALSEAMADLAAGADAAQGIVSASIRDHQLAAAAEAASHLADRLAAVAGLLGIPIAAPGQRAIAKRQPIAGQTPVSLDRDTRLLIDRLARLDRTVASASATEGVGIAEPGVASQSAAPAGAAGPGGGAPAESPQPGILPPGAEGIEQVWSLVPEQSMPLRPRAADAATFPSHRRAIDAYYRLLLEQERPKP